MHRDTKWGHSWRVHRFNAGCSERSRPLWAFMNVALKLWSGAKQHEFCFALEMEQARESVLGGSRVSDPYVEVTECPQSPLVCFQLAGKQTFGPVHGHMGYRIGWRNTSGPRGPDGCGWLEVRR